MTQSWRRVWIRQNKRSKRKAYEIRWYDDRGKLRSRAVGTDRKLAERVRREWEISLNTEGDKTTQRIDLKDFATEHLDLMKGHVTDTTLKDQKETLERFVSFGGDVKLDRVTPRMAEGYLMHRRQSERHSKARKGEAKDSQKKTRFLSPATVNKDLRTLKAIFQKAVEREYIAANPFAKIKPTREPEKEIRVLTGEEIDKLIEACPNLTWKAFVFLALTTGLREGELCYLEWEDVDLDNGLLHVRCKAEHRTKSARNRVIALVPAAIQMVAKLRETSEESWVFQSQIGSRLRNNLRRTFRSILKRAGIPHCCIHDLRRTFLSYLAMAGVNEAIVQKLAGHSSMETTLKHYTRILPDAMKQATQRLPYASAPSVMVLSWVNKEKVG